MNGNPRKPRTPWVSAHRSIPAHGSTGSPRTGMGLSRTKHSVRAERSAAKSKYERQPARTTHPLGLSPPKHSRSWFDRLTTNANGPGAREKPPFVLSVAQRSRSMNGNPPQTPFVLSVAQRSRRMDGSSRKIRPCPHHRRGKTPGPSMDDLVVPFHRSIPDHGSTGSPEPGLNYMQCAPAAPGAQLPILVCR